MAKTIIVVGYGVGISKAVAEKFGGEGFSVALVARNAERLAAGVKELEAKGIKAAAVQADMTDPKGVADVVAKARALGPIAAIQWNPYAGDAGNVLEADVAAFHRVYDVAVTSLSLMVKAALADLKAQKGSVLVTNGGFGLFDAQTNAAAAQMGAMGLSLANAAKHKLVGMLFEKLKGDGVYVGELMVLGTVKGTAWDRGDAKVDPKAVANKFWDLHSARSEAWNTITGQS